MTDPYAVEFTKWSKTHTTVVRSVFALHLAEAVLPPFDTIRTVLGLWCEAPPSLPTSYNYSTEEVAEFQEAFDLFEKYRGDGTVSTKHFGTVMRALGRNPADQETEAAIQEMDPEGLGTFTFDHIPL